MIKFRSGPLLLCWLITLISTCASPFRATAQERMSGYSQQGALKQREVEEKFKRIPSPEEVRKHHRFFTAEPHPAGSERNNDLARHVADLWKQQGLEDVRIHRYDGLSSYPREANV